MAQVGLSFYLPEEEVHVLFVTPYPPNGPPGTMSVSLAANVLFKSLSLHVPHFFPSMTPFIIVREL